MDVNVLHHEVVRPHLALFHLIATQVVQSIVVDVFETILFVIEAIPAFGLYSGIAGGSIDNSSTSMRPQDAKTKKSKGK